MTKDEMAALNQYMDTVEETILNLKQRLEEVERVVGRRLEETDEARTARALVTLYRGTWSADKTYIRGQLATDRGSLWLAVGEPVGRPGEGDSGWRLVAKRGRDGRDRSDGVTR